MEGLEAKGIKEILELMEGLKIVTSVIKEIAADGKISVSDILTLMRLSPQMNQLTEAFKGVKEIPAELKDLSKEEAQDILEKVFEILAVFKAA